MKWALNLMWDFWPPNLGGIRRSNFPLPFRSHVGMPGLKKGSFTNSLFNFCPNPSQIQSQNSLPNLGNSEFSHHQNYSSCTSWIIPPKAGIWWKLCPKILGWIPCLKILQCHPKRCHQGTNWGARDLLLLSVAAVVPCAPCVRRIMGEFTTEWGKLSKKSW